MKVDAMNERDLKVRRQWLIVFFLSIAISPLYPFLEGKYNFSVPFTPAVRYIGHFISLVGGWIVSWIMYRCVYRKPGTKFLSFTIALTALGLISTPIIYLSGMLPMPVYIPYYQIYILATNVMGFCWLVVCWRMRKVNRRLKQLSASIPDSNFIRH